MICPRCLESLTPEEIKSLWGAYCATQVRTPGGGAKPWAKHSDKAGKKCRCVHCNERRELRLAAEERQRGLVPPPITEEDLSWDAMLNADPTKAYEALIRHEESKVVSRRRNKLKRKLASEKFESKMKLWRERAEKEGVWGKIQAEAEARADKRCPKTTPTPA